MPSPDDTSKSRQQDATDVFAAWLRDAKASGDEDFERLSADRPEMAGELRKLYSAFQLGRAAASSL